MAPEKVTIMILYVDLKCPCCYKKVRKILCKFPQIRDQVFDVEKNKVMIKVVCCDPEWVRDKLCCRGGKTIQSIEIVENKPKPPEKPKEPEKPKPVEKPKEDPPKPVEKPKVDPPKPDPPKPEPPKKPDPPPAPAPAPAPPVVVPQPPPVKMPEPVHVYPHPQPYFPPQFPSSTCCQECYEGRDGGPCHYGYGRPAPPPPAPCYDGYGYGYQYGGNRPSYPSRCDYYFSEDNTQGCSIM